MKLSLIIVRLESLEHEVNHGQAHHRFRRTHGALAVFGQATALAQPSKGAFHRPANGQQHPTFGSFRTVNDVEFPRSMQHQPVLKGKVVILAVRKESLDSADRLTFEPSQKQGSGVGIVNVRRRYEYGEQ